VFFKGCPLKCWWCHNPESRNIEPEKIQATNSSSSTILSFKRHQDVIGKEVTVQEVMHELEKDILYYDESGGGVTFSGGEPLIQTNFLKALLIACKREEIHTTIDTCGYVERQAFETVNPWVDLFYFDIKLIDKNLHEKYTGVPNTRILQNLNFLITNGKNVELRIPLIPGITDTKKNITQTIEYIKSLPVPLPVHLLPYNQMAESKSERLSFESKLGKLKMQTYRQIQHIKNQFYDAGILVA
jgi:pyruvate formate lyase activating enzyme